MNNSLTKCASANDLPQKSNPTPLTLRRQCIRRENPSRQYIAVRVLPPHHCVRLRFGLGQKTQRTNVNFVFLAHRSLEEGDQPERELVEWGRVPTRDVEGGFDIVAEDVLV